MNPVLFDFPTEFYTERLFIRMPLPGDGKLMAEAVNSSIEEFKPWLPFAQEKQTVEEAEAHIRKSHAEFLQRTNLQLLVFLKDTDELIASSGLHRINWDIPKFEIGYWLDSRFSGKGYMTEAVEGIAAFAFKELHAKRLEIRCDARNKKSRAVAERVGFNLEGILENSAMAVDGSEIRDTCVYAKVIKNKSGI